MADDARRSRGTRTREGSAARRLLWAVVGAVAYTVAYLVAKYVFGF